MDLAQLLPNAVICIGTYPVPGNHPRLRDDSPKETRTELNPAVREAASLAGAHTCELQELFCGCEELRPDGVHPGLAGESLLAEAWFETVFPLLERQGATAQVHRG